LYACLLNRPSRYCRFTVYIKQAPLESILDASPVASAASAAPAAAAASSSSRALPLLNTSAYKKHVRFVCACLLAALMLTLPLQVRVRVQQRAARAMPAVQ
jgi:hypothetical protein